MSGDASGGTRSEIQMARQARLMENTAFSTYNLSNIQSSLVNNNKAQKAGVLLRGDRSLLLGEVTRINDLATRIG